MYKVAFYTLGCKVNTYETEAIWNLLKEKDFIKVDFDELADVYIINTCSVTNVADRKSRKMIRKAVRNEKLVCVMGCYSQTHEEEVKEILGLDIIIGTKDRKQLVDLILDKLKNKELKSNRVIKIEDISNFDEFESLSVSEFEHTRAFIKIEDGCNNFCSYCIIPYARGRERSKGFDECIKEAEEIAKKGYKEIVLTGIHSGAYFSNGKKITDLIEEITKIETLERVRISSLEINQIDDKFLELLKYNPKLANHLHLPLQAGTNKILKLMNRKYDLDYFKNKIAEIRSIRPDIAITTDVIVGFPEETKEDFKESFDFIKEIGFYELHVFPYSKRENTVASKMVNQVPEIEKTKRCNDLIMLGKELKGLYEKKFLNKELDFIPEQKLGDYIVGHTSNYLKVFVLGNDDLIGKIVKIKIEMQKDDKIFGKIL